MGAPDFAALEAFRLVDSLWARHFAPRIALTVDQWADAHRFLPRGSAEAGPWRTDRTPYARQIYGDLSDDAPFEDIVLMCGTQLVKSEAGLNWLGSIIDQTPAPIMVVQATVETAKRYSKQRIGPMIEACPTLKEKVKDSRSRDSGNTTLMKEFPGGALVITGANSAAGLASMPARFIHFDERDDYPDDVDGQGEPTKIARARQDTYRRRKRLTSSSVKRPKGESRILKEFEAGTRFRYFVPCPHCEGMQVLQWVHLWWKKEPVEDPDTAAYTCEHCAAFIEEHHKDWMLERGVWRAENPDATVRSYHLSSLYSPYGWLKWSALVQELIEALEARDDGDEAPYKAFVGTRLAEGWEEQAEKLAANDLQKGAEDFALGIVPMGGLVVVASVDVQDDRFEIAAWAFGERDEMWLFDYVVLPADPGREDDWKKLDAVLLTRYKHAGGNTVAIEAAAIDTGGHYTHDVYRYVRSVPSWRKVSAIKGGDRPGMPIMAKPTMVDVNWRGGIHKGGVKLWHIGVHSAKDLLYARLKRAGQVHLSAHLPAQVFEQLTAEHRVKHRTARGMRNVWKPRKPGARNEAWDLGVYAVWCGERLGLSKWPKKIWEQLRARIAPTEGDLFAAPAPATIVTPRASAGPVLDDPVDSALPTSAAKPGTEVLDPRVGSVVARPGVSRETKADGFVRYESADAET